MVTDGAPAVVGKREPFVKVIEHGEIVAQNSMFNEVSLHSTSRKFMHKSFING